jgi:hypothetical protein
MTAIKRCVIDVDPDILRAVLGIPEGAIIDGIGYSGRLGVIQLHVCGYGLECEEGALLPAAQVVIQRRKFDGEEWHQATARVLPQQKWRDEK